MPVRILLAIDESPFSENAIREVEQRFAIPDTTVRVLHVIARFVPSAAELWYDAGGSLEASRENVVGALQRTVRLHGGTTALKRDCR